MTLPLAQLEGPRVRLRGFRETDVDDLFALHSDARVMRYWSHPAWTERKEAEEKLASLLKAQTDEDVYLWAIADLGNDSLIGNMALFNLNRPNLRADVGYALLPALQGKGLAREALRLGLTFAFDQLGLERVEADIDPRNLPSRKLVEHLGFKLEGTLRSRWRVAGEVCDTSFYGLLRAELVR